MYPVSVSIDTQQQRVQYDRTSTLVAGEDWGWNFQSNVFIEPTTLTAILQPLPYTAAWATTGTGQYKRYTTSDYNLITPNNWINDPNTGDSSGNPFENCIKGIAQSGDNSEIVTTSASQPSNGAMYLSWFGANAGSDNMLQMACGWGTPNTAPISFNFYADGKVDVYTAVNGVPVYQNTYSINGADQSQNPQQTANAWVTVTIHPFRRREIMVISNRGGGFTHLIDSIDPTQSDPEIIPPLPFWWQVPSGLAKVACAPCLFQTSGYITGVKSFFGTPPQPGQQTQALTYADANGGGTVASLTQADDPTSSWSPDGSSNQARVRVDLTGNGVRTPNLYGAMYAFQTSTTSTDAAQLVLDQYITRLELEVPDSGSDIKWTVELKSPQALITAGAVGIYTQSNRPYNFTIGGSLITDGVSEAPKRKVGLNDVASRVTTEVRDLWKLCEHYLFTDPTPLDGLNLVDAFKLILSTVGITNVSISSTAYTLPKSDAPTHRDFAVLINPGDSAAEWLTRLHENYCANWLMGFKGSTFYLTSPSDLPSTSSLTLYQTVQAAVNASVASPSLTDFIGYIFRGYSDQPLEPEANDIWVIGRDLRTGLPLVGHKADTNGQNPSTPPDSRPGGWLGEIRKYGIYDATISDQNAVDQCINVLYDRLTAQRIVAEFTSDFLLKPDGTPIWRGDIVTLDGYGDFRIKGFSTNFEREPNSSEGSNYWWRPTKYICEQIGSASGVSQYHGLTLAQIILNHELRCISKSTVRSDALSQGLVSQIPLQVTLY